MIAIFIIWVGSLLCLPLFRNDVHDLYVVGDISLYTYIIIAPPYYDEHGFAIQVAYALIASGIGIFILYRLRIYSAKLQERYYEEFA